MWDDDQSRLMSKVFVPKVRKPNRQRRSNLQLRFEAESSSAHTKSESERAGDKRILPRVMAVSGVGPVREECDWNNASPSLFSLYSRTASAPTLLSLLNRRQFCQFSMSLLGNTIRPAASTALGDKLWVPVVANASFPSFLAILTISAWLPHHIRPSFLSFKYKCAL